MDSENVLYKINITRTSGWTVKGVRHKTGSLWSSMDPLGIKWADYVYDNQVNQVTIHYRSGWIERFKFDTNARITEYERACECEQPSEFLYPERLFLHIKK